MEKLDRDFLVFQWRTWTGYICDFLVFQWRTWTGYIRYAHSFQWRFWTKKIANIARPTSPLKWRAFFYVSWRPHLLPTPNTSKCCSTVKSGMASSTTYQKISLVVHTFFSEKALILYAEIGLFKCASAIENLKTPSDVTSKNGLLAAWFRVVAQVIGKLALKRSYWA